MGFSSIQVGTALALSWALAGGTLSAGAADLRLGKAIDPLALEDPSFTVEENQLQLSLDQAIDLALERNLALIVQRYDYMRATEGIRQQQGIYDLNLSASLSESENNNPSTSSLDGVAVVSSNNTSTSLGLRQLVPTGGTASFDWSNGEFSTNNTSSFISPSFSASASFSFVQPLLRGLGKKITNVGIIQARRDQGISRENFEQQVVETIRQVENGYWELVRARKQLEVSQQSLDLARELHERNRIRVEVGTLAPFELVQSEAGIAQREGEIIRNQAAMGDAEDTLRRLLNLSGDELWDLEILPVTDADVQPMDLDVSAAIQEALESRPEVRLERLRLERLELDSAFFRNQRKPRLDLTLSYGSSGVDGRVFGIDPVTGRPDRDVVVQDGDLSDAIQELIDRDSDGWSIALNFGMPLQNRPARAISAIADLSYEEARADLSNLEQQISTEVRSAARLVDAAARQVDAARASRRAQEKSLEAERKRFENGMSTSFQVLQIQEDLAGAQSAEVQAVTDYRNRLLDYYRSIGKLLEERNIQLVSEDA